MKSEYVTYEEVTLWPPWVAMLIGVGFLVPAALIGGEGLVPGGGTARMALTLLAVATPVAFWMLLGRMRVRVTRSGLELSFGYVSLIRKRVAIEEIRGMEAVSYSPLREFGGWGIRGGRGGKQAWTIRGNRALRLELSDGKSLYVGSAAPERLGERIRAAGGMRRSELEA